ncbi:MAG: vitamin B12-dependent ribonucleotide reductase [Microthrixaceae bacterium]|nr:vitamin B12-dependent ribonucleotide reductase [Microthrixaceae bacterium]
MSTLDVTRSATLTRWFTEPGRSPYEELEWSRRDARLVDHRDGSVAFEQNGVEFPTSWSVTASNIVTQKYFRGPLGSDRREHSLRQVIDRVVDTITRWGTEAGHFGGAEEAETFAEELRYLLVNQRASFNSPVWFNIGVPGVAQQAAACFILEVDDELSSILNWYAEEGVIFKGGSGAGTNLSRIRSASEELGNGGTPSGPVSFMRGADASAGTIKSGGTTRRAAKMVILDVDHPDVEEFIWCKAIEERKAHVLADAGFDMDIDGADSFSVQYQNANNSVRLTDDFMEAVLADGEWELRARTTGEVVRKVPARSLLRQIAAAAWECADPGVQFDTTINDWNTTPNAGRIEASNPCSEHLRLNNSACNLASVNLLPYLGEDGQFDVEGFIHTCRVLVTAQDILVGGSDYPTDAIAEQSRRARDIGLGYTNLGASLMAQGLAYDSEDGRAWAAAVTGILTGAAAVRSTELAEALEPAPLFATDSEGWSHVYAKHLDAARAVDAVEHQSDLNQWLVQLWEEANSRIAVHGARNAELTVAAPTGTISFMMGADTTGIEPELALVKHKKLVGGGTIEIVNQTVPRALRRLGYDEAQIAEVVAHVAEHHSVLGAPHLAASHLPVFACAFGDDLESGTVISHSGHLAMMVAIQPFFSGAMSKTVNLPESTSAEEIERLLIDAWKGGLKCVALYRDNCKVSQPLNLGKGAESGGTGSSSGDGAGVAASVAHAVADAVGPTGPVREKLPRSRRSRTFEFRVADCKGFVTVGEYEDGRPGELFIRVSKQGSTLAGIMDAFAISVSHGLQYGVPLESFVGAFVGMRFEPAGMTDDPEVRIANSLIDYLFRRLAVDYLDRDVREALGVLANSERMQPALPGVEEAVVGSEQGHDVAPDPPTPALGATLPKPAMSASDAPMCMSCGVAMTRAGSCYVCNECGTTSGCS